MVEVPRRSPPHLITLILLTGISVLSLNMFLPSLPSIATSLSSDYATVSLAIGGYLAVTALVQLAVGPLSDRVGRRPVMLGTLSVFTLGSVGCALASSIEIFLLCRLFQAAVISGYAISLAVVRDTRDEQSSAKVLATISMAMALAPMLGPVLGGFIDSWFGWRANFAFYALVGGGLLVLCWFDLGETLPSRTAGQSFGSAGTGLLLRSPKFWGFVLCSAFSTGAFYSFLAGAPLVSAAIFNSSSDELGIFIGSITTGFMAGSFITSRLAGRIEGTSLIIVGRLFACFGMGLGIALLQAELVSPLGYFGCIIFVGFGNGLTLPSSNAGALSVHPGLAGTAAGLNGAATVAIGAVLTTFTGLALESALPRQLGLDWIGPAETLLLIMLASSALGLAAVLVARARPS